MRAAFSRARACSTTRSTAAGRAGAAISDPDHSRRTASIPRRARIDGSRSCADRRPLARSLRNHRRSRVSRRSHALPLSTSAARIATNLTRLLPNGVQNSIAMRSQRVLQANGVPASAVQDSADCVQDAQLKHRGHLRRTGASGVGQNHDRGIAVPSVAHGGARWSARRRQRASTTAT